MAGNDKSLSCFSPLETGVGVLHASCPPPVFSEASVELPASGGATVRVDADVAQALAGRRITRRGHGYFAVRLNGRPRYLHHIVCPRADGQEIDHMNRDRSDNRRANLRLVSHSANLLNSVRTPGSSGFRGARWEHQGRCYRASFMWKMRSRAAGTYRHAVLAAMARDDLAVRTTGLREGLNFPETVACEDLSAFLDGLGDRPFEVWFVKRKDGSIRRMTCLNAEPETASTEREASLVRREALPEEHSGVSPAHRVSRFTLPISRTTNAALDPGTRKSAFDPAERGLRLVLDVMAHGYRFIPLEGVLCLSCNGTRYRVLPSRTPPRPSTRMETWCALAAGWLTSPPSSCSSCPDGANACAAGWLFV